MRRGMAKVVLLSCCQDSIIFQKKCLSLREGDCVPLGRADLQKPALKTNGFFECPALLAKPVLSRKHAELLCNEDGVYMRCFNKNTFMNGERIDVNVLTKIEHASYLMLGGYLSGDSTVLAEGSVVCFISIFDASSENLKYFLLVEREFPFCCQWPGSPPSINIRLEVLYSAIIDRLEVLKVLAGLGESELDSPICDNSVPDIEKLNSYLDLVSEDAVDYVKLYEQRRNDYVSQHVLAVACCRNFRTRNWFITQERKLFILRWQRMLPYEQTSFLGMLNADYSEVPDEELKKLAHLHPDFFPASLKYYKVPFTEAPAFVKRRRICLIDGYCLISLQDMYAPLIKRLRTSLWDLTKVARSNLDKIWYEDRIRSIIRFVEDDICDPDRYKPKIRGERVSEHNIYKLCDESFPLCMKVLHYHLCRDHHLRNGGRFQYTLFLKGIGLSMTGSLRFWKAHFTKKIEETVFMKRYSYHIRHAYGVEGKMADYPPQNCADIMKAAPGPLEYHGCPFKVLDEIRMKEALYRSGLKKEVYSEILELVRKGTPQDACKRYFELTQKGTYNYQTVAHPNIYYDESRRIRKERKEHVTVTFESANNPEPNHKASARSVAPVRLEW